VQANCLGEKNGITLFFETNYYLKKKVFAFMKNEVLLLAIYTDYEPGIDYAQRWAGK